MIDAAQHGEFRGKPVGHHLEHRGPSAKAAQEMLTQGPQRHPAAQQNLGSVGHEHLPAVSETQQSRGPVEIGTGVAGIAGARLTCMESHPDGERDGLVSSQFPL